MSLLNALLVFVFFDLPFSQATLLALFYLVQVLLLELLLYALSVLDLHIVEIIIRSVYDVVWLFLITHCTNQVPLKAFHGDTLLVLSDRWHCSLISAMYRREIHTTFG